MTDRNHPVSTLLFDAARGRSPSAAELDAIAEMGGDGYPGATLRRQVKEAAERIRATRLEGANGAARDDARETASELIEKLPEYQEPPGPLANETDPRKLSEGIRF